MAMQQVDGWGLLTGMVKEGYYFGLPLLFAGVSAWTLEWRVAAYLLLFLAAFVFSFFRDPERVIPATARSHRFARGRASGGGPG